MVDYSVSYYRADRYKLWVPLQRPGRPPHAELRFGVPLVARTLGQPINPRMHHIRSPLLGT